MKRFALSILSLIVIFGVNSSDICSPNPCDATQQCAVDASNEDGYQCSCNAGFTTCCSEQINPAWGGGDGIVAWRDQWTICATDGNSRKMQGRGHCLSPSIDISNYRDLQMKFTVQLIRTAGYIMYYALDDGGYAPIPGCSSEILGRYFGEGVVCDLPEAANDASTLKIKVYNTGQRWYLHWLIFRDVEILGMPTGNDDFVCNDIDECADNPCVDLATCSNTPGSFTCDCPSGYTGDGLLSGNGCSDIPECTDGSHQCVVNSECIEEEGGYDCVCNNGYTGDGFTECVDICTTTPCGDNQACEQSPLVIGGYTCSCDDGFEPCCSETITPSWSGGGGIPSWRDEWTHAYGCETDGNSRRMQGRGQCISPTINAENYQNLQMKFTVQLINTAGYVMYYSVDNGVTYAEICNSNDLGWDGVGADVVCDLPAAADNAAELKIKVYNTGPMHVLYWVIFREVEIMGTPTSNGDFTCEDIDECDDEDANPCVDNAVCSNSEGSFTCDCNPGFSGDGLVSGGGCVCDESQCGANAACVDGKCGCDAGYQGDPLTECEDIDECAADPCDEFSACVNKPGGYECRCNDGYSVQEDGNYVCSCYEYFGECCSVVATPPWRGSSGIVPFRDEWVGCGQDGDSRRMQGKGSCVSPPINVENLQNLQFKFTVQLFKTAQYRLYYSLDGGGFTEFAYSVDLGYDYLGDADPIDLPAAVDNAKELRIKIYNTGPPHVLYWLYFRDVAILGVPTTDGDLTCSDNDECANDEDNDCNDNATCNNTGGSFTCLCNDGYIGDGITCTNIDECALGTDDCHKYASCIDTDGSFECQCNDGFTGDGKECIDIDECEDGTHTCDASLGQGCDNNDGGYECEESYFGFYASSIAGSTSNSPIITTLTLYDKTYTCSITPSLSGRLYSCTFSGSTIGDALDSNPWNGVRFTNNYNDGVYIYRLRVHDAVYGRDWDIYESFCMSKYYGWTVGWYGSGHSRYSNRCEYYSSFNWYYGIDSYFESGAIWVDNNDCRYKMIDVYLWLNIPNEAKVWPRTKGYCSSSAVAGPDTLDMPPSPVTDGDNDDDGDWKINLTSTEVFGIGGLLSMILLANIMCICYTNCNGKRRKKKGYAVVQYDSESFDESEANVINVAEK